MESANEKLITDIKQLGEKLAILLSNTLFDGISAKLNKMPNAPNVVEIIRNILEQDKMAKMEGLSGKIILEKYVDSLISYYEELIKVLNDNIIKKSEEFVAEQILKSNIEKKDINSKKPINEKKSKNQELILKIQTMKALANKFPSKEALDLLKSYLNQDHKLKMGIIILLSLVFSLYFSKDTYMPKIWPKNMNEMLQIISTDCPDFKQDTQEKAGLQKLSEIFNKLLIPLMSTKIAELKQAFQIAVIIEYLFIIGALLDLHDPTKLRPNKAILLDVTYKFCPTETIFKMAVMLLCNSNNIDTKKYFADILTDFVYKKSGLKTMINTLLVAKWPMDKAQKVLTKLVCSVPKNEEPKKYLESIIGQIFIMLEQKSLVVDQKNEIAFSIFASLVQQFPEITADLVLNRCITKITELYNASNTLFIPNEKTEYIKEVSINACRLAKEISYLTNLIHRLDILPDLWSKILSDNCLFTILELYAKGVSSMDNRLFLAEVKNSFDEFIKIILSAKNTNREIVARTFMRYIQSYLSEYDKIITNLCGKTHAEIKIAEIQLIKYFGNGEYALKKRNAYEYAQNYNKISLKEEIFEEYDSIFTLLGKLCKTETTGNAKFIAKYIFIELLKSLDETLQIAEGIENIIKIPDPLKFKESKNTNFNIYNIIQKSQILLNELTKKSESSLLYSEAETEFLLTNLIDYAENAMHIVIFCLGRLAEQYEGILDQVEDYLSFVNTMLLSKNIEIQLLSLNIIQVALEQNVKIPQNAKLTLINMFPRVKALCNYPETCELATQVVDLIIKMPELSEESVKMTIEAKIEKPFTEELKNILDLLKSKEPYEKGMALYNLNEFIKLHGKLLDKETFEKILKTTKQQLKDNDSYILVNTMNLFKSIGDINPDLCIENLLEDLEKNDPLMGSVLIQETNPNHEKEEQKNDPVIVLYKSKVAEAIYRICSVKGIMFSAYKICPILLDRLLKMLSNPNQDNQLISSYFMIISEICKRFEYVPVNLHTGPIVRTAINYCKSKDEEIQKSCINIIYSIVKVWPEDELEIWSKEISLLVNDLNNTTQNDVIKSYCKNILGLIDQRVKTLIGTTEGLQPKTIYTGITKSSF